MNLFSVFGIGGEKIRQMGYCVPATVTHVRNSRLYVVKKPVRIGITEQNTLFSHYIHFTYTVDHVPYQGTLFISPNRRCPQAGETIDVFCDPGKPQNYACRDFGPAVRPIGW